MPHVNDDTLPLPSLPVVPPAPVESGDGSAALNEGDNGAGAGAVERVDHLEVKCRMLSLAIARCAVEAGVPSAPLDDFLIDKRYKRNVAERQRKREVSWSRFSPAPRINVYVVQLKLRHGRS